MGVHANSLAAYRGSLKELGQRELDVYQAVSRLGKATDRQVMEALRFKDMNTTRPRISAMVAAYDEEKNPHGDWLEECGTTKDHVTRRKVRLVRALRAEERNRRILARADGQGELI